LSSKLLAMPRPLSKMKSSVIIEDEQRRSGRSHLTPAMVPKLPSDRDARRRLRNVVSDCGTLKHKTQRKPPKSSIWSHGRIKGNTKEGK
jgi:hypothetical protein